MENLGTAVISRTRRITASTNDGHGKHDDNKIKWACGYAVVAARIFGVMASWRRGGGVGGGGSVGDFCQGTLCQGVWYQVTESPKRSRNDDQPVDK